MIPKFHPAVFLGAVILVCAAWLWVRPPVSAIETVARGRPRPALVVPKSIELDQALLERYVGRYEGRGGFAIDLTLKRGTLFAQGVGSMPSIPYELRATSETEFFLMVPGSPNPPTRRCRVRSRPRRHRSRLRREHRVRPHRSEARALTMT